MSDRPTIVTPEGVAIDLEPAGPATRILARLIDLAAQLTLFFTAFGFIGVVVADSESTAAAIVVFVVAAFLVVLGYPVALETMWRGRTIGKAILGVRVIADDGGPIGFRHAAVRSIFAVVDVYATLGVLAVTSVFVSRRYQRLGDLAAGTIVVRLGSEVADRPVRFEAPTPYAAYADSLPIHRLGSEDYQLVRDVILRLAAFRPEARASVGTALATEIERRLDQARPQAMSADTYLVCVAAAYQRAAGSSPSRREPPAMSPPTATPTPTPMSRPTPPREPAPPAPGGVDSDGDGGDDDPPAFVLPG